jgi:hypothetical protein
MRDDLSRPFKMINPPSKRIMKTYSLPLPGNEFIDITSVSASPNEELIHISSNIHNNSGNNDTETLCWNAACDALQSTLMAIVTEIPDIKEETLQAIAESALTAIGNDHGES